jgi:hypothetical protein
VSHLALRRVVVRLLHDPVFAAALAADPARALAGIDLDADERAWLLATPAAAWRTDPARPDRVLAALAAEFPATLALVPERARTFFASPSFHAAVQARGSLAAAFAEHLACEGGARVRAVARLEGAVAERRRARAGRAPRPGELRLAHHLAVVRVATGALDLLAALRAGTRGGGVGPGDEPVLVVVPPDGEATIEPLAPALAALLELARGGVSRSALTAEARRQGADPGEDDEIIDALISDRSLVGADGSRR